MEILFIVLLLVAVVYLQERKNKRSSAIISSNALSLGFDDKPSDSKFSISNYVLGSDKLKSEKSLTYFSRESEYELSLFVYYFEPKGIGHARIVPIKRMQTVACLRISEINLPRFYIRPRKILNFHSVPSQFKAVEILDSNEFCKNFEAYGVVPSVVSKFLNSDICKKFNSFKGFCFESDGPTLLVYRFDSILEFDELSNVVEMLREIFHIASNGSYAC